MSWISTLTKLSKTLFLGVIVLAIRLLRDSKIPVRLSVSAAAAFFGVSRRRAYEASRQVLEALSEPPSSSSADQLRRDTARLKIRCQVLAYERDHPSVRFSERDRHLPREARSLSVRLLREFQDLLPRVEIAGLLGVPPSSLSRWDRMAGPDGVIPEKAEQRGLERHYGPEDEEKVVRAFKALEESVSLEEFARAYAKEHPDRPLDRRSLTRILQRRELVDPRPPERASKWHDKVEVHFPGAQAAIDGVKCTVDFTSGADSVTATQEVAIDIATRTVLGTVLGKEETTAGVERAVILARKECRRLLAVLADNRSSNSSADIEGILAKSEGTIGAIFTFPAHPTTNGHIEGLFGEFSRVVGRIQIDDRSPETIAHSVLQVIWRVYVHFHNHSPRASLGGKSRMEYLREYSPEVAEVEAARRALQERQRRSKELRAPHPRLSDLAFVDLVRDAVEANRLEIELEHALESLLRYDSSVIASSSRALRVASQRDGFEEKKRNFAYFMGIVRKKQSEVDKARARLELEAQETRRRKAEIEAEQRKVDEERAEERRQMEQEPERVILTYARRMLQGRLVVARNLWERRIQQALESLDRLGRARDRVLGRLTVEIHTWSEFAESLKEELVSWLVERYRSIVRPAVPT